MLYEDLICSEFEFFGSKIFEFFDCYRGCRWLNAKDFFYIVYDQGI